VLFCNEREKTLLTFKISCKQYFGMKKPPKLLAFQEKNVCPLHLFLFLLILSWNSLPIRKSWKERKNVPQHRDLKDRKTLTLIVVVVQPLSNTACTIGCTHIQFSQFQVLSGYMGQFLRFKKTNQAARELTNFVRFDTKCRSRGTYCVKRRRSVQ